MGEFFKSTFDFLGKSSRPKSSSELVGYSIEIAKSTFMILNIIAEGGFSIVYEAEDINTHRTFALKRLTSHNDENDVNILAEINYLKKLHGHPNIVNIITAASIVQQKPSSSGTDFFIVMELCTGGQIIQLMQRRNTPFPYDVTLQIFYQVCNAIEHMHSQNPPIIHRDVKVDNLLITDRAVIKLCDFGSATIELQFPDNSWSGLKRSEIQEEIERHTTPMYRAPEMLDLYQNFPIMQACDIWALGCVMFYFCVNKHPFEDYSKLAIINAKYSIPTNVKVEDGICALIYQMLLIDPRQRLLIIEIINELRLLAALSNISLTQSVVFDKDSLVHLPSISLLPDCSEATNIIPVDHERPRVAPLATLEIDYKKNPSPPKRSQSSIAKFLPNSTAKSGNKLPARFEAVPPTPDENTKSPAKFRILSKIHNTKDSKKVLGLLKDGAGSIMKNIRGASNKVKEQVSSSINRTAIDHIYVTSRIIMMPTAADAGIDLLTKDNIKDVKLFLDLKHPNQYFIYNLGLRSISSEIFKDRLLHYGFDASKSPRLNMLVTLCIHQLQWLLLDSKNVIVVQCDDGYVASGINIVSLLCFCGLVSASSQAVDIVRLKRGKCSFTPSQLRYADYICQLKRSFTHPVVGPDIPHNFLVKITGIEIQPIPVFNKSKTGVCPLVEIFSDYRLVYSSMINYKNLCLITADQNWVQIPISNVNVRGDLNVVVYHIRENDVIKGKISSVKICEAQVFTGFLSPSCTEICLSKDELDNCDPDNDKYPAGLCLKIHLFVTGKNLISSCHSQPLPWKSDQFQREIVTRMHNNDRMVPFTTEYEMQACMLSAGIQESPKENKLKPQVLSNKSNKEDFLVTLDWISEDNYNVNTEDAPSEHTEIGPSTNNDDSDDECFDEDEEVEAVGDLLGAFEMEEGNFGNDFPVIPTGNGVIDDLEDFFATFSAGNDKNGTCSTDMDLLAAFSNVESNYCEDVAHVENYKMDRHSDSYLFDPLGQFAVNSNSSTDLTDAECYFNDSGISGTKEHHQTGIKASNSTSCLSSCVTPNEMKKSPSFDDNRWPRKIHMQTAAATVQPEVATKKTSRTKIGDMVDTFEDLLGDFKTSESKNCPENNSSRSIKEIRNETSSRIMSSEELKIHHWVEGRERNIRGLLCSLSSILWSEVRWPGVHMSELVTIDQVKTAYRNAIRCVHPDKWNNTECENLAKMIMMELNEAMVEFEMEKNACW